MVSSKIKAKNIALFNENLRYDSPEDIIRFALQFAKKPIVTTSFGAHSAAILNATTQVKKDIQVIWCDTGFNTEATHIHASRLIEMLSLDVEIFTPIFSDPELEHVQNINELNRFQQQKFAEIVKLEPFRRAMAKHRPDVWFTTVRKNQTAYRDTLDILSITHDGILKVSPFYHYTDDEIKTYLEMNKLPVEYDYFDPVKDINKGECGIQLLN